MQVNTTTQTKPFQRRKEPPRGATKAIRYHKETRVVRICNQRDLSSPGLGCRNNPWLAIPIFVEQLKKPIKRCFFALGASKNHPSVSARRFNEMQSICYPIVEAVWQCRIAVRDTVHEQGGLITVQPMRQSG